jgi:hypothetical protein
MFTQKLAHHPHSVAYNQFSCRIPASTIGYPVVPSPQSPPLVIAPLNSVISRFEVVVTTLGKLQNLHKKLFPNQFTQKTSHEMPS